VKIKKSFEPAVEDGGLLEGDDDWYCCFRIFTFRFDRDNMCGADWYYYRCRFKFRFHGIIVSLVTYGTEVGKSFEDLFFFLWRGFE
jgi:hypothetical protein